MYNRQNTKTRITACYLTQTRYYNLDTSKLEHTRARKHKRRGNVGSTIHWNRLLRGEHRADDTKGQTGWFIKRAPRPPRSRPPSTHLTMRVTFSRGYKHVKISIGRYTHDVQPSLYGIVRATNCTKNKRSRSVATTGYSRVRRWPRTGRVPCSQANPASLPLKCRRLEVPRLANYVAVTFLHHDLPARRPSSSRWIYLEQRFLLGGRKRRIHVFSGLLW